MKRWSLLFLGAIFAFLTVGGSDPKLPDGNPPPELQEVVDGNSAFALHLYAKLKQRDGNFLFSPYSISSVMAIAYAGAENDTRREMADALHVTADPMKFHSDMVEIQNAISQAFAGKRIDLNIANGLWPQKGYLIEEDFLNLAKEEYRAEIRFLDFQKDPESARRDINSWIARQTNEKILEALPSGALTRVTRLTIVNAIYFKGEWLSRFDKEKTERGSFRLLSGDDVETPMMRQEAPLRYWEGDGLKTLELPYAGGDLSMLVLLPTEAAGLSAIEDQLTLDNLRDWTTAPGPRMVDVQFPKFAFDVRYSLKESLREMGMVEAFEENSADFTGMSPNRPLFIDRIEHAALIAVDERGTEAAAATSVSASCAANAPLLPATFHADHPFIYFIRDNHTGTILFLGRVVDPRG